MNIYVLMRKFLKNDVKNYFSKFTFGFLKKFLQFSNLSKKVTEKLQYLTEKDDSI